MVRDQSRMDIPKKWFERKQVGLCPPCGKTQEAFEKGRRIYCSSECSDKWLELYTSWSDVRGNYLEGREEVCDSCSITSEAFEQKTEKEKNKFYKVLNEKYKDLIEAEKGKRLAQAEEYFLQEIKDINNLDVSHYSLKRQIEKLGEKVPHFSNRISFEVDHIEAIALGGEQWDKKNFQLLCVPCHKEKTKKDMKLIVEKRKGYDKIHKLTGE